MSAGGRRKNEASVAPSAPALRAVGVDSADAPWVSKPCPLCQGAIEVREQAEPQAVVCPSCGLSCTIDASPPPLPEPLASADDDDDDDDDDATNPEEALLRWLERQPPRPASLMVAARPQPTTRRRLTRRHAALAAAAIAALVLGVSGRRSAAPGATSLDGQDAAEAAPQFVAADRYREVERSLDLQLRERTEAEARRASVEREVRSVTAKYLAAKADGVDPPDSLRGVALAVEAVQITLARGEPIVPEAHQALRDALGRCAAAHRIDCISLPGHRGAVVALAASPDGRWLVTGGDDQVARLWNLAAADPSAAPIELRRHRARVNNIVASPDGRWLATSSRDATLCIWDLTASDPAKSPIVLPGNRNPITGMTLSPDGRWLVTYCANANGLRGSAQLWDLAAGVKTATAVELTGLDGVIRDAAMSPDSRWLAVAVDQSVRLWDLATREPAVTARDLQLRQGVIAKIQFTADGKWLATCGVQGSSGGVVRLWPLGAGDLSASVALDSGLPAVHAVAASADGRWLVAAGVGAGVAVWDLRTDEPQPRRFARQGGSGPHTAVRISADSRWLAAIGADGNVSTWELSPAGPAESAVVLRGGQSQLLTLTFSPDNRWMAAAGMDGAVRLWTLDVKELVDRAAVLAARATGPPGVRDSLSWDMVESAARRSAQWIAKNEQCAALSQLARQSADWVASQGSAMLMSALHSNVTFFPPHTGPTRYQPVAFDRRMSKPTTESSPADAPTIAATAIANPTVPTRPVTAVASRQASLAPAPTNAAPPAPTIAAEPIAELDWSLPVELPPIEPDSDGASAVALVGPELSPPAPKSGARSIVKRIVKAITPSLVAAPEGSSAASARPPRTAAAESKSPAVTRR